MNLIKKYLSYSYKGLIIGLVIAIAFAIWWSPVYIILFFLSCGRDVYHFDAKLFEIERLKAKGLTEEDARHITFVKSWEQTRNEGKLSYCLFDGGVVSGGIIGMFLCFAAIKIYGMQVLFAELSGMFFLIGGGYLAGALIATCFYWFRWKKNEAKFKQLTQFEHLIS